MSEEKKISRRRFLGYGVTAAVAAVVSGVGSFMAAQGAQPQPAAPATVTVTETVAGPGAPPRTVTVTQTAPGPTVTQTVPGPTVTVTQTVTPTPAAGEPIRVGYTLPLTGFLSANAIIHDIADQLAIERINAEGGLLPGRPVERVLYDDRSLIPEITPLYERLITEDRVDLILGPYATPHIAAGMAVAEAHGKLYIHDSYTLPKQAKHPCAFSGWPTGYDTDIEWPTLVFEALQNSDGGLPKSLVLVSSTHPGAMFVASGVPKVAEKFGIEVLDTMQYELGTTDFLPIATRIKELKPDFLFQCGLVLDETNTNQALEKVGFRPKGHHSLWPAFGPLLNLGALSEGLMSQSVFEAHSPFTLDPEAEWFIENYEMRAREAGLAYWKADTQGATSYTMWQILREAVRGSGSIEDQVVCNWLKTHSVHTIIGDLRFDGPNNYGPHQLKLSQIQNGVVTIVWPPEWAKPGAKVIYPAPGFKGY